MKNQELLYTQTGVDSTNTENNHSSKKIFERIQIPNSPFWLIGTEEQGYHITMGKYKITQQPLNLKQQLQPNDTTPLNDYEKTIIAQNWLTENLWDITLTVALCAAQDLLEQTKNNNNQNQSL